MHTAGERLDHGTREEGSRYEPTSSRWTAKEFEEKNGESSARYHWKEEVERVMHNEAMGGCERNERSAMGIERGWGE